MGSKKLKAIAATGSGKVPVANPARFAEVAKKWREDSIGTVISTIHRYGTATGLERNLNNSALPVKNLTTSLFPEYKKLTGQYIREAFKLKKSPCFGCSINHCNTVTVTEGPYTGFVGEEPEYESLSNLGSNIGVSDPGAVTWLSDYVDRLGFDGNWAGAIVAWAMEAFDRGVLSKEDTGGLELSWGDEKAAAQLLKMIAYRQGIGDTLALGLKRGAEEIGGEEAASFAVHFKGETNHAYDSRVSPVEDNS